LFSIVKKKLYGAYHLKTSNAAPRGQIFKSRNRNDIRHISDTYRIFFNHVYMIFFWVGYTLVN
jgi:hypothetical protein